MLNLTIELQAPRGWRGPWVAWLLRIALPHRWARRPRIRFDFAGRGR